MGFLKRLKRKLASWLLSEGADIGDPLEIRPNYITFPELTADPILAAGRIWFRSDLQKLRYSPDGSTVKDLS